MSKRTVVFASILVALSAQVGYAQVSDPELTVINWAEIDPVDVGSGRTLTAVSGAFVAVARVEWPVGAKRDEHNHPRENILIIVEGRMRMTSDGKEIIMGPGDVMHIPSFVPHGYEALEDTVTLEAVSPSLVSAPAVPTAQ